MGRGHRLSRTRGHRRAASRLAGCAVLLLVLAGCGDDESSTGGGDTSGNGSGTTGTSEGSGGGGSSTGPAGGGATPDPALAQALARLSAAYDASPAGIAQDLGLFVTPPVNATEVEQIAVDLCESTFDPDVVLDWFDTRGIVPTWMVAGPAQRLLDYTGSSVCNRAPTQAESSAYLNGIWAALPDPLSGVRAPTEVESVVCEFLGSRPGGAVVESVLTGMLEAATRGRVDPGEAIALGVEVAGAVCPAALPTARAALETYLEED